MTTSFSARLAAAHARLRTVGVTGTNGKTTTTTMIAAIVAAAGEPAARVTTVGAWVDGERIVAADLADEFLATVERAATRGVRTLAVEMTSKALGAGVARQWRPEVGVFTNVTRDHLDHHGTPEAYLAAKAQLALALAPGGTVVLNGDDPALALVAEVVPAGVAVRRFSTRDRTAALIAERVEVSRAGTRIALGGELAPAFDHALALRVVGDVHAENALAAALAAHALGYSADAIRRGLAEFAGVPGRFEMVARAPAVVVDYAHTPDGLARTLATARALAGRARVVCVFGCGGDRDRGKRPAMGAIADASADLVVLTSDNPRREDPTAIARDILAGVATQPRARWLVELDRARAIERAIAAAAPEDLVVIAGKGHEQTQECGGVVRPFSDAAEVARIVSRSRLSRVSTRIDDARPPTPPTALLLPAPEFLGWEEEKRVAIERLDSTTADSMPESDAMVSG